MKCAICILSELVILSPDSAPSCCLYCFQNSFPDNFDVTSLLIPGPFCPNPAFWCWRYIKSSLVVQTKGHYPGCLWVEGLSSGHRFCWSRSDLAFFLQQAQGWIVSQEKEGGPAFFLRASLSLRLQLACWSLWCGVFSPGLVWLLGLLATTCVAGRSLRTVYSCSCPKHNHSFPCSLV